MIPAPRRAPDSHTGEPSPWGQARHTAPVEPWPPSPWVIVAAIVAGLVIVVVIVAVLG